MMSEESEDTSRALDGDDSSTTTSLEAADSAAVAGPTATTSTSSSSSCLSSSSAGQDAAKEERRSASHGGRRPRFGTGAAPASPYIWIDGRQIRSALAYTKKWPPRRVSFPTNDTHLVTGYLEPANPWKHACLGLPTPSGNSSNPPLPEAFTTSQFSAENVNREDLINAYKESCRRHSTDPLESVLTQLENLDMSKERCESLSLKGQPLNQDHCESLEEILKRVQFNKIDLEGTALDDESSVIVFDMLEYYESAKQLNISSNQGIAVRGWQACAHMLKKTQCLEQLEAKDVTLNEQYMNILSRALRLVCHLHVLKLENCGLSGRPIVALVTALKSNTSIKELYLADNGLDLYDAIQLGSLLRLNNHVQLLDISNNNIQDDGAGDILEGLINQLADKEIKDREPRGLHILILWNNRLTNTCFSHVARIIAFSKTLETLNIGKNALTSKLLVNVKDSLKNNRTLLQFGLQSTELANEAMVALSEVLESNQVLQRIDLRDNSIHMTGMRILAAAMKENKSVTQIDLDDRPRTRIDGPLQEYKELVEEIRGYCERNESFRALQEESTEERGGSGGHCGRGISASSRKISLTCQTLPRSSGSCSGGGSAEESGREQQQQRRREQQQQRQQDISPSTSTSLLEAKRAGGGRLRSPAPSPIPSPLASPIPSPSRSRFVVSRVPEASLSSASSSASSSPLTPPSQAGGGGGGSGCFFPGVLDGSSAPSNSASSRFRVSVVEPATRANVTVGFTFKVDGPEAPSAPETRAHTAAQPALAVDSVLQTGTPPFTTLESPSPDPRTNRSSFLLAKDESPSASSSEDVARVTENRAKTGQPLGPTLPPERVAIGEDPSASSSSCERKLPASVQRQQSSSLERLLSLFQHPGSFFSDSSNAQSETRTYHPLQDGVSGVIALGDKFQQYLKDGRGGSKAAVGESAHETLVQRSKPPPRLPGGTPLPSIPSFASILASFKTEAEPRQDEPRTNQRNLSPWERNSARKEASASREKRISCAEGSLENVESRELGSNNAPREVREVQEEIDVSSWERKSKELPASRESTICRTEGSLANVVCKELGSNNDPREAREVEEDIDVSSWERNNVSCVGREGMPALQGSRTSRMEGSLENVVSVELASNNAPREVKEVEEDIDVSSWERKSVEHVERKGISTSQESRISWLEYSSASIGSRCAGSGNAPREVKALEEEAETWSEPPGLGLSRSVNTANSRALVLEEEDRSAEELERKRRDERASTDSINPIGDGNSSSGASTCDKARLVNANSSSTADVVTSFSPQGDSPRHVDASPRSQSTTVDTRTSSEVERLTTDDHHWPKDDHRRGKEPASKCESEELIFCMTDICSEGSGDSLRNSRSDEEADAHRNSQDSGIEDPGSNVSEDGGDCPTRKPRRSGFQESVDSGVDAEGSSFLDKAEEGRCDSPVARAIEDRGQRAEQEEENGADSSTSSSRNEE